MEYSDIFELLVHGKGNPIDILFELTKDGKVTREQFEEAFHDIEVLLS